MFKTQIHLKPLAHKTVVLQTEGLGVGLVTHRSLLTVSVNYKLALATGTCKD